MEKYELKRIKDLLGEVVFLENSFWEKSEIVEHEYSKFYKERISEIIAQNKSNVYRRMRKVWASIIAVVLLLSMSITIFAFREEIKEFIIEKLDGFTRFSVEEDETQIIDIRFSLNFLPEGYKQCDCIASEYSVMTVWENGDKAIILEQGTVSGNSVTLDTEKNGSTEIFINERLYYYSEDKGVRGIVWHNNDYIFFLSCPSELPWSEVERMILSIAPRDIQE